MNLVVKIVVVEIVFLTGEGRQEDYFQSQLGRGGIHFGNVSSSLILRSFDGLII